MSGLSSYCRQKYQATDKLVYIEDLGDYLEQLQDFHVKLENMIQKGDRNTVVSLLEANFEALMDQLDNGIKGLEQAAMLDVLIQLSMSLQDTNAVPLMLEQVLVSSIISTRLEEKEILKSLSFF